MAKSPLRRAQGFFYDPIRVHPKFGLPPPPPCLALTRGLVEVPPLPPVVSDALEGGLKRPLAVVLVHGGHVLRLEDDDEGRPAGHLQADQVAVLAAQLVQQARRVLAEALRWRNREEGVNRSYGGKSRAMSD